MLNIGIGLIAGIFTGIFGVIIWSLAAIGSEERMRTRNMRFEDYGVFSGDEKKIKEYCQNISDPEDRLRLFQCAINAAPGLEMDIYESLITGKGYRTILKYRNIPAREDDFYAYKRKAMAEFYDWLRITGRWVEK